MPDWQRRVDAVRVELDRLELPAILVSDRSNVGYLTGFFGSAGLALVTQSGPVKLVTDSRYELQAAEQAPEAHVTIATDGLFETMLGIAKEAGVSRLGFESQAITYASHEDMRGKLDGLELVATKDLVIGIRSVKEPDEIEAIRRVVALTDRVYELIMDALKPGMTEKQIATQVDRLLVDAGADKPGFDTIAATGPRSAFPHAVPTHRELQPGDLLKLDFGARLANYCSDMTRTICFGRDPDEKQMDVYSAVSDAQLAAIEAIAPGVLGKDVDAAARAIITDGGYGDRFGHGVGHGVGLDVHELPSVSKRGDKPLDAGQIVTIEPGIYIKDWGGVRIEDMVLVTESGHEVLTASSRAFFAV